MGQHTKIQWCDSTVNLSSGCDGCELWPGPCYAGALHEGRLALAMPTLYAPDFATVREIPGRMAKAAAWPDLRGKARPDKPWLDGMPRAIFVGDMGDVFSKAVTFEFLAAELIASATSPKGARHVWMVLTKRPARLVEFAAWLREGHGIDWPENIWVGTSVTGARHLNRADALARHPAAVRFLSLEPLRGPVRFGSELSRFRLAIFGGESRQGDHELHPCDPDWIRDGIAQCRESDVPAFVKQLGSSWAADHNRWRCSELLRRLMPASDSHGGNMEAWPADLRVREFPAPAGLAVTP